MPLPLQRLDRRPAPDPYYAPLEFLRSLQMHHSSYASLIIVKPMPRTKNAIAKKRSRIRLQSLPPISVTATILLLCAFDICRMTTKRKRLPASVSSRSQQEACQVFGTQH